MERAREKKRKRFSHWINDDDDDDDVMAKSKGKVDGV